MRVKGEMILRCSPRTSELVGAGFELTLELGGALEVEGKPIVDITTWHQQALELNGHGQKRRIE